MHDFCIWCLMKLNYLVNQISIIQKTRQCIILTLTQFIHIQHGYLIDIIKILNLYYNNVHRIQNTCSCCHSGKLLHLKWWPFGKKYGCHFEILTCIKTCSMWVMINNLECSYLFFSEINFDNFYVVASKSGRNILCNVYLKM